MIFYLYKYVFLQDCKSQFNEWCLESLEILKEKKNSI